MGMLQSKLQDIIVLHRIRRETNGNRVKTAKNKSERQKQKAYKREILHRQKIAMHKSFKLNQNKQKKNKTKTHTSQNKLISTENATQAMK